jgi:tetratricopeptide (TPR) repeat protein
MDRSQSSPTLQAEPALEFESRCLTIVNQWQAGSLPFVEASNQLGTLKEEAEKANHLPNEARAEFLLGYLQHYRGNLDVSIHHYERARLLFERAGNQAQVACCDIHLGESYRYKGDFNRARRLLRQAHDLAIELNVLDTRTAAMASEAQILLRMGQYQAARDLLEEAYQLSQEWPPDSPALPGLLCEIHHGLAVIHLSDGQPQAAWSHATRALEIAQTHQNPLHVGYANRTAGEVLTMLEAPPGNGFSGDPNFYFQAANLAFRSIHAEGEVARTLYAHGKSLARRGKRVTSARKLQQAMDIFTRLGMIDDAARAAEAQLEVL